MKTAHCPKLIDGGCGSEACALPAKHRGMCTPKLPRTKPSRQKRCPICKHAAHGLVCNTKLCYCGEPRREVIEKATVGPYFADCKFCHGKPTEGCMACVRRYSELMASQPQKPRCPNKRHQFGRPLGSAQCRRRVGHYGDCKFTMPPQKPPETELGRAAAKWRALRPSEQCLVIQHIFAGGGRSIAAEVAVDLLIASAAEQPGRAKGGK